MLYFWWIAMIGAAVCIVSFVGILITLGVIKYVDIAETKRIAELELAELEKEFGLSDDYPT